MGDRTIRILAVPGSVRPGSFTLKALNLVVDEGIESRIRSVARNLLDYIHGHICPKMALEEMVRTGETQWMERLCGD